MKNLIRVVVLAAGVLLAPAAAFGVELNVQELLGDAWYIVTDQLTGYDVSWNGNTLTITSSWAEFQSSGQKVAVARVLKKVKDLGNVVKYNGGDFTYPTTLDFLRDTSPGLQNLAPAGLAASPMSRHMDRQPLLTCGADVQGSLTVHPEINLAKRLGYSGCTDPRLAPNQRQWLQDNAGKAVPGTLYVNLMLAPEAAEGTWKVASWNYAFAPNWEDVVLPAPECPAGSPGTWPECDTPPPPACPPGNVWDPQLQSCEPTGPPPGCPEGYYDDGTGKCVPRCLGAYKWDPNLQTCVLPPPKCPECGQIDPGLKFSPSSTVSRHTKGQKSPSELALAGTSQRCSV